MRLIPAAVFLIRSIAVIVFLRFKNHPRPPIKPNRHPPQLPIPPILLHIQIPSIPLQLLQHHNIIRLLRRLRRPRHRTKSKRRLVQFLAGMDNEDDVDRVAVAEVADSGDGLV